MIKARNSDPNNPIIGYLNINNLQNKIISLREIIEKAPLDVFCVDETKLDDSFPNSRFILEISYSRPSVGIETQKGGGKLVNVKQEIIAKKLENLETKFSEATCTELFPRKNSVLYLHISPQNKTKLYFSKRYQAA